MQTSNRRGLSFVSPFARGTGSLSRGPQNRHWDENCPIFKADNIEKQKLWDWKAPGEAARLALLLCFLPASDEIFTRGLLNRRAVQIWRAGGNKTAAERAEGETK